MNEWLGTVLCAWLKSYAAEKVVLISLAFKYPTAARLLRISLEVCGDVARDTYVAV